MRCQNVQKLFVHKGLTTQNTKEGIAHRFGFGQCLVHGRKVDLHLLGSDIYPTTLASQIAGINDGDVQERRKKGSFLETRFVLLNTAQPLKASQIGKLPKQSFVCLQQQSLG
jgi:hypothetical protein